ncbi:glycoside hydrolase family 88 protein [Coraliomargarita parva]|uniref:glycoside hydrolase family 88 protein n=1 Tax=Coraliomargarita parva TaxID=3014050 RepID=UPI0022B570AC|nr:glycoside hydrolase family 88 protein [Coraliomargarita parva]
MLTQKRYFTEHSEFTNEFEALEGKTGPKSRPLMTLSRDRGTLLTWTNLPSPSGRLNLVLTFVIEAPTAHRSNCIQVYYAGGDQMIAQAEVKFSDPYQVLSISLPKEIVPEDGVLSLELKLAFEGFLWVFAPDSEATGGLELHVPHLVDADMPADSFLDRLATLASLQTFSWKEGCVLDALQAFSDRGDFPQASKAIRDHLEYFNFSGGDLEYETPRSFRVRNELDTIETTLPFTHVALIDPQHPWVDMAMDFWRQLMAENGQVQDEEMISSEGAYTVAYPMTLIAKLRNEPEWFKVAEDLLVETFQRLVQPEGIYLRHYTDGRRTHKNWVRGLCWQILGHVQVLKHQPEPSEVIQSQLIQLAEFAAKYQLEDGLWACFVDEPEVLPDTSGSVGVAAAFAMAAKEGYLPSEYYDRAFCCRDTARTYLTAEGYLSGCSQSNKAGEALQRSDYRVTLPYALGLFGLLEAACLSS